MQGNELRRLRRQSLDMTQAELAKALGVTSQSISNYERAKTIPLIVELAVNELHTRKNIESPALEP